ncbi:unnamed protein product [Calypogeia fissa]
MAMAMCSFRSSPCSVLFHDQRRWLKSSPILLSSLRSRIRENSLQFQGAFSNSRRQREPSQRGRWWPGRACANNATTTSTNATVTSTSAVNLQNVIPQSVIAGTPVLLGALVPVVFTMYFSKKLNLGLKKEVQVAVFRATAQLSALGFALKLVFEGQNIALSVFFMTIMVVVAGQTSGERSKLLPRSKMVSTAALVGGAFSTLWLMVLLKVFPMEARYMIPATAFLVGNSMTVVAITLNCIQREIDTHKLEIEAALALGATPPQAINEYLRMSLIRGLGPIFDHMKVSGLVTLPGAMTGMLMRGSHPPEAVKSSLVLLYMLVGAAYLSSEVGAQPGWRFLFSPMQRVVQFIDDHSL